MRYRVPKKWPLLGLGILLLFVGLITKKCFLRTDEEDSLKLEKLGTQEKSFSLNNTRYGVQKEFWFKKGDEPVQIVLRGDKADIVESSEGIIEKIEEVVCEIYEGNEKHLVEASNVEYIFSQDLLRAFNAMMSSKEMTCTSQFIEIPLKFSSQMIVRGDTTVSIPEIGTFQNNTEVTMLRDSRCHMGIKEVRFFGETNLVLGSMHRDVELDFRSFDEVYIDNEEKRIYFTSPDPSKQVCLIDPMTKVFADSGILEYTLNDEERLIPIELTLLGNVRLICREGSLLQYALADRMLLQYDTKELILKGKEPNRVLFYDRMNNLEMSAPELKLTRISSSKSPKIEGLGDVRFHFLEQEFEQIKKRFLQTKIN